MTYLEFTSGAHKTRLVPMILIRLKHRFRERALEWFCAAQMLSWGASLLMPYDPYLASPYGFFEGIVRHR